MGPSRPTLAPPWPRGRGQGESGGAPHEPGQGAYPPAGPPVPGGFPFRVLRDPCHPRGSGNPHRGSIPHGRDYRRPQGPRAVGGPWPPGGGDPHPRGLAIVGAGLGAPGHGGHGGIGEGIAHSVCIPGYTPAYMPRNTHRDKNVPKAIHQRGGSGRYTRKIHRRYGPEIPAGRYPGDAPEYTSGVYPGGTPRSIPRRYPGVYTGDAPEYIPEIHRRYARDTPEYTPEIHRRSRRYTGDTPEYTPEIHGRYTGDTPEEKCQYPEKYIREGIRKIQPEDTFRRFRRYPGDPGDSGMYLPDHLPGFCIHVFTFSSGVFSGV